MRGRKPTPTVLKLVKGNPGKRPLNEKEPEFATGIPPCPSWLKSKVGKAEWKAKTKLLSEAGVLTVADDNTLAMYCYIVGEIDLLTAKIAETGYMAYDIKVNKDTGEEITCNPKTNPLALRLEKMIDALKSYSALFGLDAANRGKIKSDKKTEKKPEGKDRFFK